MGLRRGAAVAGLVAVMACWSGTTLAQATAPPPPRPAFVPTPPVVPPPSELAPSPMPPPAEATPPPRPEPPRELGKPEVELRIDVVRYEVDPDAPAELRAALPRLTERYTGKARSFEDLVDAATEVTRFLQRDLGYYLGYAYVPEQAPADGVVRIAVLEGRLDRVELNWTDALPVRREVIEGYLARLRPGAVLRVVDIERVVFLVNDLYGISARFEIKAGSTPGTATLVVTPVAEARWSGRVDADANNSRFLGTTRLGGLVQLASPLGRGDALTANALVSEGAGLKFGLVGYVTPIGSDGFKLGASVSTVRYELDRQTFPIGLDGDATTYNVYALYPSVRSRNLNLFTLASLEHKTYDDRQGAGGGSHTRKDVDALTLGVTGDFRDDVLGGGVNTYQASLAAGRVDYPAGRPAGLDDSRTYAKLDYGASRLQDLITGRLLLYGRIEGQQAFENLDTTEQFRLGGPEGLRGFAPGEATGDNGTIVNLELRLLPPEDWLGRSAREFVFSSFVDLGYVQYRQHAPAGVQTLPNNDTFADAGLGLAWVRAGEYALRTSLAWPLTGKPRSDPRERHPRVYLLFSRYFP